MISVFSECDAMWLAFLCTENYIEENLEMHSWEKEKFIGRYNFRKGRALDETMIAAEHA